MIRIARPLQPPDTLQLQGPAATSFLCDCHDAGGELIFEQKLYGAADVKETLCRMQHDKCAFCESKVTHVAYGDVEHFRPKAGSRQRAGDPLLCPGYYWLAYHWDNLFFACQMCNERFKRNLFPLRNPRLRARSHHHRLEDEKPLLLDPVTVDPAKFLFFRGEYVVSRRGNAIGRTTIELLGVNREELVERRRAWLRVFQRLLQARRRLAALLRKRRALAVQRELGELDALIRDHTLDTAEYAAMAQTIFAGVIRSIPPPG